MAIQIYLTCSVPTFHGLSTIQPQPWSQPPTFRTSQQTFVLVLLELNHVHKK